MTTTGDTLPHLLTAPSLGLAPEHLDEFTLDVLKKVARTWLGPESSKFQKSPLMKALRPALHDRTAAKRVLEGLSPAQRTVLSAYRRYGGTADGEVIRLDLMARGVLEVEEERITEYYAQRNWKRNPVRGLEESWVLLSDAGSRRHFHYGFHRGAADQPFARNHLHPNMAALIKPAGPPPWPGAPAAEAPRAIAGRSPAEVALDLSRLCTFVAERGAVKVRKDGVLATPTLRAMEKAVPLADDSEFALPDPHALYFELLRAGGAVQSAENTAVADPAKLFAMLAPLDVQQAYSWAHGWLHARCWYDGLGAPEARDLDHEKAVRTCRQVLAWALGSLAHYGDRWYELNTFLAALDALQGDSAWSLPYTALAWDPKLPPVPAGDQPGNLVRQRLRQARREPAWYANALMVTLVALGLVERGRLGGTGGDRGGAHLFRLTALGRAVFGAPEVAPPTGPGAGRFLVVQPNFDLLAYMEEADAPSASLVGRMAESGSAQSGPVRTFRLTQSSIYQAEESGLSHDRIVAFLEQHARGALPANVLRSLADWSGKRARLVLRSNATLLGFPSEADRDAYLKQHTGTACGTRFVLAAGPQDKPLARGGDLTMNHLWPGRRTLVLDEHGRMKATEPLDIVQRARIVRITQPIATGWQISAESIGRAAAAGMRPSQVHEWLSSLLATAMPSLLRHAVDAWIGKTEAVELGDAVILHVPADEPFRAIAASPRLQPYLLGSPGPHWFLVRREARKPLAAALKELGFIIYKEIIII